MSLSPRESEVLALIDEAHLLSLAKDLVAAAGENPGSTEAETVRVLAAACGAAGLEVTTRDVAPERPNLWADLAGGGGPGLMFLGHSDVVPAGEGWCSDPFEPVVIDGRLYGRGSTDMKGGLAAVVTAMKALKDAGVRLRGPVRLASTVDEEDLGTGIRDYVADPPPGDFLGCVVAEPTDLDVVIGCRGDAYLALRVEGKAAHSGRPSDGRNAIVAAARVLELLREDDERLKRESDELLGSGSWSPGTIIGGTGTSIVAARCEASIDRRIMPEESASEIAAAILDLVSEAGIDSDGIRVELEVEMEMPGFRTPPEHPLPNAAVAALTDASGLRPSVGGWSAACDGGYIARDLGVPCIVFGPGGLNDQAHQANESVGIDELIAAARAYALLALRLIGEETA